ncbi:MAG: alpha/beta hydrolase [Bacteriovoracaceae bacterium]|nr:alpha/beta hydrolase [Bacteriovoracaceae bacterium]
MEVSSRNNVKVFGSGQPIIFAHGFGCDQNMWRLVYPAFEETNKVILFDHVGAGKSDEKAFSKKKYNSLSGYAEDVLEIIDALSLKDVIFVGHSVSSMIGVLASIKRPDLFSKLILVGPSPRYINSDDYLGGFSKEDIEGLLESLDDNYLGWSSNMAPVIMGNPDNPELAEELKNSFCRTNPDIAKHFARVTFLSDNRSDLSKVTTESLVLQCSEDVIAPNLVGEYVADNIANSTFVQMKAKGHCPNLSSPQETIAAIKAFIK